MAAQGRDDPQVLELRIHGIDNTAPAEMLDLPADSVRQAAGDALGSFWTPRRRALRHLTPRDRGYVPPGIRREAYSWGGLARTSVGSATGVGSLVGAAARVGWSLLIPFGLVNVAYWSRRLLDPPQQGGSTAEQQPGRRVAGGGAATLRLAGLLLTLLLTSTVATVTLDLLGVQCFADPAHPCSALPAPLAALRDWPLPRRLALLSLVPLLLLGGLWWLAGATRDSYATSSEEPTGRLAVPNGEPLLARAPDAATTDPRWPLLAAPGFWRHALITQATGWLHLAAVALLLAVATAWHLAFGTGPACARPLPDLGSACARQVGAAGPYGLAELGVVAAGGLLLAAVAVLVWLRSEDAADVRRTRSERTLGPAALGWVVGSSAALYVVQLAILLLDTGPWAGGRQPSGAPERLLGVSATPAILLAGLLGTCLAASTWRYTTHASTLAPTLAAVVAVVAAGLTSGPWTAVALAVAALGVLAVVVRARCAAGGPAGPRRRYEAWAGCAPGVMLVLSVLLAMTLSGGVVVTVGNLLNGGHSVASLAAADCVGACGRGSRGSAPQLLLPRPLVWWGVGLLGTLVAWLLLLAFAWVRQRRDRPASQQGPPEGIAAAVASARRFARLAQRAEKITGALAALGWPFLALSLVVAVTGWSPERGDVAGLAGPVLTVGMLLLALVGIGVVGLAAGGSALGTALGSTRPLGIVWDLICFLPRAGHPFGPPCYAVRAVPEILGRVGDWLRPPPATAATGPAAGPAPDRRVILSAHSLGGVLAVATVLATATPNDGAVGRLSLLTYGSQLRAYFGRVFPELLGPQVLGTPPSLAAELWSWDPWRAERARGPLWTDPEPWTVLALLGAGDDPGGEQGRWLSLWRDTDYIGLPVHSFLPQPNPVDRRAEVVDRTGYLLGVLRHRNYPRSPAFAVALTQLARTPGESVVGPAAGAGPVPSGECLSISP